MLIGDILIIDDDEEILGLFKDLLTLEGLSVDTASNGLEGWSKFKSKYYDIVILDIKMPTSPLDGLGVLKRINKFAPFVCVIMITGYPDEKSIIESNNYHAFDYLIKPVDDIELLECIKEGIKRKNYVYKALEDYKATFPINAKIPVSVKTDKQGKHTFLSVIDVLDRFKILKNLNPNDFNMDEDDKNKLSKYNVAYFKEIIHDDVIQNVFRGFKEDDIKSQYDVFLCYNHIDRSIVIAIGELLIKCGLAPWLDIWSLRPGTSWTGGIENNIDNINSAAVFLGNEGIGPSQEQEIKVLINEFIGKHKPVIPVILPGIIGNPKVPVFLQDLKCVDFRNHYPEPLAELIWGITGKRYEKMS